MGFDTVTIKSNGTSICVEPINERVRQGAYNSQNWHRYSEMVLAELKKQNNVTFEIDKRFASYTFNWREFLYTSIETIHFHVMFLVRHCFSQLPADLPTEISHTLYNR